MRQRCTLYIDKLETWHGDSNWAPRNGEQKICLTSKDRSLAQWRAQLAKLDKKSEQVSKWESQVQESEKQLSCCEKKVSAKLQKSVVNFGNME